MSFFSIPKMVTNYNDAIQTCELDSLSANASSNPVARFRNYYARTISSD